MQVPNAIQMKTLIVCLTLLFASLTGRAQEWAPDFAAARATAAETHKPIVLVFSGSDWCAPCIKLDREIWQDQTFQEESAEEFVFYRADFPRKKENKLSAELTEANAQLGNAAAAVADLDVIRNNAGLDDYDGATDTGSLIDEVLRQRRYELYAEGHRWIDLRRYGRLGELPIDRPNDDVFDRFPIPEPENV